MVTRTKRITDFKVVRALGRGAFGQVFMVRDSIESKHVMIRSLLCHENHTKIFDWFLWRTNQHCCLKAHTLSGFPSLHSETTLCLPKRSQTLPTLLTYVWCISKLNQGELFYLLRRNRKFPEEVAKFYAAEILLAL